MYRFTHKLSQAITAAHFKAVPTFAIVIRQQNNQHILDHDYQGNCPKDDAHSTQHISLTGSVFSESG